MDFTDHICEDCSTALTDGVVVRITTMAEAGSLVLDENVDAGAEIKRLLAQLEGATAAEADRDVFTKNNLFFCTECYRAWLARILSGNGKDVCELCITPCVPGRGEHYDVVLAVSGAITDDITFVLCSLCRKTWLQDLLRERTFDA